MSIRSLTTFEAFHRLVPSLVARLSQDRELAICAMANPILAIEDLGIELTPEVAREVERRARFSEKDRDRLAAIEARLFESVGETFDPESSDDLERVLFSRLKLRRPEGLTSLEPARRPVLEGRRPVAESARPRGAKGGKKGRQPLVTRLAEPGSPPDPLLELKGHHPVVDLLLQHRAISLRVPKLAPRPAYEALKAKARSVPIGKVVVHLPRHVEGQDA